MGRWKLIGDEGRKDRANHRLTCLCYIRCPKRPRPLEAATFPILSRGFAVNATATDRAPGSGLQGAAHNKEKGTPSDPVIMAVKDMKPVTLNELKDLGGLLADLVAEGSSTYLQVLRRTGPFVGIGLLEGRLVFLQCGAAEGQAAVPLLKEIGAGDRVLFWPPRQQINPSLPDTREVFAILQTELPAQAAALPKAMEIGLTPAPQPRMDPVPERSLGVDKEKYAALLLSLARQYFGPIADLMLDDVLADFPIRINSAHSSEILKLLAKNLRDPVQAKNFVAAASAKVQSLF